MGDGTKILHLTERVIGGQATILEQLAPAQNDYFGRHGIRFAIPANEVHLLAGIETDQIVTFPQERRSLWGFGRYLNHVTRIIRDERPHLMSIRTARSQARQPGCSRSAGGTSSWCIAATAGLSRATIPILSAVSIVGLRSCWHMQRTRSSVPRPQTMKRLCAQVCRRDG
jgi:hypothetical protein